MTDLQTQLLFIIFVFISDNQLLFSQMGQTASKQPNTPRMKTQPNTAKNKHHDFSQKKTNGISYTHERVKISKTIDNKSMKNYKSAKPNNGLDYLHKHALQMKRRQKQEKKIRENGSLDLVKISQTENAKVVKAYQQYLQNPQTENHRPKINKNEYKNLKHQIFKKRDKIKNTPALHHYPEMIEDNCSYQQAKKIKTEQYDSIPTNYKSPISNQRASLVFPKIIYTDKSKQTSKCLLMDQIRKPRGVSYAGVTEKYRKKKIRVEKPVQEIKDEEIEENFIQDWIHLNSKGSTKQVSLPRRS